jgi:hypothetical protein
MATKSNLVDEVKSRHYTTYDILAARAKSPSFEIAILGGGTSALIGCINRLNATNGRLFCNDFRTTMDIPRAYRMLHNWLIHGVNGDILEKQPQVVKERWRTKSRHMWGLGCARGRGPPLRTFRLPCDDGCFVHYISNTNQKVSRFENRLGLMF